MGLKCIGDVHGKYDRYKRLIRGHKNTIQVGDMGVGFFNLHGDPRENPPYDAMVASNAQFIRGNHDNPSVCKKHSQWIPDGFVETGVMFVGGAYSIDHKYRVEGCSWWPDEELSIEEFNKLTDVYATVRPHLMITHDAPLSVVRRIHGSHHAFDDTRTQQALQAMFEIHQPNLWIHGHHHVSVDHKIEGTRFVCLAELELKEF